MSIERSNANIPVIQSLRGIAALMIVVFHLHVQTERLGLPELPVGFLQAGVDIFFVVSGFIMWVTTARNPQKGAFEFLRDRIVRIVPLYWTVTGFLVAVLLVAPELTQSATLEPYNVLLSFAFLPAENPALKGAYLPVLVPGWTLNLEMFFYALFAVAIWWSAGNLKHRAILTLLPLAILGLASFVMEVGGAASFYVDDIIIEFGIGAVIGMAYLRRSEPPSRAYLVLSFLGFLSILLTEAVSTELPRSIQFGVPSALIVIGLLFAPSLRSVVMEKIGDWSYSLYLIHPIVLSATCQIWRAGQPLLLKEIFPVIAVLSCVGAAGLVHYGFERPVTRALKRRRGLSGALDARVAAGLP
jgi:exopolysaccharide production protein ExoZ